MKIHSGLAACSLLALTLGLSSSVVLAAEPAAVAAKPAENKNQPAKPIPKPKPTPAPTAERRSDQLILDSTVVTGNRELPNVMYIVPWKKAELSDLPGQPFSTLVDEALAPVDRDVFRREVEYYQVIADKDRPSVDQAGRQATPAANRK